MPDPIYIVDPKTKKSLRVAKEAAGAMRKFIESTWPLLSAIKSLNTK